jgi:hypothetical protein
MFKKKLHAALQYYADKGQLMTLRRANTEEISLVAKDGQPLATLRTQPITFIQDIWETKELDDDYVSTTLVCAYIPPIDKFEEVWEYYRGMPNVIVNDIKLHKGSLRDLSKEKPFTPEDVSWVKTEVLSNKLTDEMFAAVEKDLQKSSISF